MLVVWWRWSWGIWIVGRWRRKVGVVHLKKKPTSAKELFTNKTPYHPITDFIYIISLGFFDSLSFAVHIPFNPR
jgi:hypothetical protein